MNHEVNVYESWLSDLPSQFLCKPNLETLLQAFSRQLQELYQVFDDLNNKTDINTAEGVNLDNVGTIVSLSRKEAGLLTGNNKYPVMSDERYRQFLNFKSLQNTGSCTYEDLINGINLIWNTDKLHYKEEPNHPAVICFESDEMDLDQEDITDFHKNLCIRPAGVDVFLRKLTHSSVQVEIMIKLILFTMKSDFYPRHNMAHMCIDGSWSLDGKYPLNGYLNDTYLDFYPLLMRLYNDVTVAVTSGLSFLRVCTDFDAEANTGSGARFLSDFYSLYPDLCPDSRLIIGTEVTVEHNVESFLTVEKDLWYLDGNTGLDGSVFLDAEIIEYEL